VNYRYIHSKGKCLIPHSSGSLSLLKNAVKSDFEKLATCDIYFEDKSGKKIENEFNFKALVNRAVPDDYNEIILDLKVQIQGSIFLS